MHHQVVPGVAVYLDRPPRSAHLVAWGRAPDAWWGCITFRQPVTTPRGRDEIPVAAWVPAASLTKPGWSGRETLPRIALSHDRTTWPAPRGWPSWFAGAWPRGPLALPAGLDVFTGPAWRN